MSIRTGVKQLYAKSKIYIIRFIVLSALLMAATFILISCANPTENELPKESEAQSVIQDDYYDSLERGPSGPLRLYWSSRSSFNPVIDQSYTGKAAFKLIYGSLLTKKEDGSLNYDLAERIIWTEDGLNLIIMVKDDQYYHDGTKLEAADAALALSYLWSQNGGPAFSPDRFLQDDQADENNQANNTDQTETNQSEQLGDPPNNEDENDNDKTDDDQNESDIMYDYPKTLNTTEVFSLLQEIRIIDEKSFKCVFREPAIEFSALLDFEIIPSSAWLSEDPWQIIPGTGRYMISKHDENGETTLVPVQDENEGPERIVLKQYFDEADAMRALEEDELDVVLLTPDSYPLYHTRNNLELIRFTGASSVFLTANTDTGSTSNSDELLAIKRILQSSNLRAYYNSWPGELADYPLPASSFLINHELAELSKVIGKPLPLEPQATEIQTNPEAQPIETSSDMNELDLNVDTSEETQIDDLRTPIRFIAPNHDHLISAAGKIASILQGFYNVELDLLKQEDYTSALQNKNYDLALCQTDLPAAEDPSWLYGPNGSVAGMENITMRGINDYAQKRVNLYNFREIWYKANETDRIDFTDKQNSFSKLIIDTAADSPYIHIYLPYAALAYGDRVKGQSNPNKYDPYVGIEELWIWSGQ